MDINLDEIFGAGGLLEKNLPNYELRPQQAGMANAVLSAVSEKKHLIVEAGTGVGKTLAYLIPSIFWAVLNKKRLLVSTYTKTLQEQLTEKDLPFLKNILGLEFKYALCVGSENYVCLRRIKRSYQLGLFDDHESLKKLLDWLKTTKKGLKMDIDFKISDDMWHSVCRESDMCLGRKCLHRSECFYQKSKMEQYNSDILVVNHHVFFTNIAAGGRVLPKYDAAVFDEAQSLEEVASSYLGVEVSNTGLNYILSRIFNPKKGAGILKLLNLSFEEKENFIDAVVKLREEGNIFFNSIISKFGMDKNVIRVRQPGIVENNFDAPLMRLADILKKAAAATSDDEIKYELKGYFGRLAGIKKGIEIFLKQSYPDYVYWVDIAMMRRRLRASIHAVPIDISKILKEKVFEKTSPVILTSATLSTDKKFDFIKTQLGLENAEEILFDSPFDYKKQVLLYLPESVPDPRSETDEFCLKVAEEIEGILKITAGRTFCLFTSYKMLNFTGNYLSEKNGGYKILRQDEAPKWQMLSEFKKTENAVLLGTSTFWQGVDVPGRALECVIITKLPFAAPDEPVVEAKMEFIEARGGNPFREFQIPQAIIMLKQGFGRLIRHKNDVGIVAILDPRIKTRGYGKKFLRSLPECRIVDGIDDLKKFYEEFTPSL